MSVENEAIENEANDDALDAVNKFDYIRFTVGDIHGIARSKTIARRNFIEFFEEGMTIFAGLVSAGPSSDIEFTPEKVRRQNLGNMCIKPMPGTLHGLPWATEGKHRVGEVFCEAFWIAPFCQGSPQEACPRYVARRQLDHLEQLGYRLFSGFEAEFYVTDAGGRPVYRGHDVFVNCVFSEFESFLYSMDEKMAAAGVDVATMHTEYGDGQFEMALTPKFGIEAADQLFLLKQAIKEISRQHHGWQATFMTKPFLNQSSNGLHFSHSLWSVPSSSSSSAGDDKSHNVFHDPSAEDGLSSVARHWIAGLLRHGRGLMALCSPTVNCYRRLGTLMTPAVFNWGIGSRSASICVKTGHPKATYFENRLPGGAANPYLVLAATVAAGIDGIVNKLECPPAKVRDFGVTPTSTTTATTATTSLEEEKEKEKKKKKKKNVESDADGDQQLVDVMPTSLSESLEALQNDAVLREALSSEFVDWFVGSKRANEIAKVAKARAAGQAEFDSERDLYFKVL